VFSFLQIRRLASPVSIVAIVAVLTGCASAPKLDVHTRDPAHLQAWQANGRMAVAGANGGGSGSFTWRQTGSAAVVQLRGPIGIGSLRLLIDDQALRIDIGDGQILESAAAEAELASRLGAEVPAQSLRYWLLGLPAPGEHAWLQTGDTAALEQNGWRIDYQKYAVNSGARLPAKFVAVSGPAKVRIVIDRWRLE
jgi:outer membrane lipoprotein LolB